MERRNDVIREGPEQARRSLSPEILSCAIADTSLALQRKYALALSRTSHFRLRETVTTGSELEKCLERGDVHLVLLDIYLRGWDGVDSLRKARVRYPSVDWMILSGDDDPDVVRGCICLGVFDYLIKPFSVERLERALNAYFQYHQGLTRRANPWRQKDLDMITSLRGSSTRVLEDPPKGIQRKLLEHIRICIKSNREAISASAFGESIGISRSTARRYLEYLVETGEATFEYDISSVGRPVKLYRLLE